MANRVTSDSGINWLMAFVIGAALIVFGLFMLFFEDEATTLIFAVIAFGLLLGSLVHLVHGFRTGSSELAARAAILSGGVGAAVGAIVSIDLFFDYLSVDAARVILASGLLVYGALALVGVREARRDGTLIRTLVLAVAAVAFALLLLFNGNDRDLRTGWFVIALVVAGLILLAIGFLARSRRSTGPASTSGQPTGGRSLRRPGRPARATDGASERKAADGPVTDRPAVAQPASPLVPPAAAETGHAAVPSEDATFDPMTGERIRPGPGQDARTRLLDPDAGASQDPSARGRT